MPRPIEVGEISEEALAIVHLALILDRLGILGVHTQRTDAASSSVRRLFGRLRIAIFSRLGKWRGTALILTTVQFLDGALDEVLHAAPGADRVIKRYVMPAVSATGECCLTIEQPVALEPGGGYPGALSCQAGDLVAIAEGKTLHVVRNRLIVGRCCVKIK